MKKRIVALCLATLMVFGMLAMTGCKQGGGNAQPNFVVPEGGFDPTQEVTITFGHTMGQASMAIVDKYIKRVPGLQKYVIMPNHIHMIISISCDNELSVTQRISSLKTLITKELGFSIFQRSFHDHIIRNEKEYLQIWEYIENNPVNWATDCFYKRI